jgi:hypothetical protein
VPDERCGYCGTADTGKRLKRGDDRDTELRPYGPGGAMVCYSCATETPWRERAARAAFDALLDANAAISPGGVVAIGETQGPRPFLSGQEAEHG